MGQYLPPPVPLVAALDPTPVILFVRLHQIMCSVRFTVIHTGQDTEHGITR